MVEDHDCHRSKLHCSWVMCVCVCVSCTTWAGAMFYFLAAVKTATVSLCGTGPRSRAAHEDTSPQEAIVIRGRLQIFHSNESQGFNFSLTHQGLERACEHLVYLYYLFSSFREQGNVLRFCTHYVRILFFSYPQRRMCFY